MKEICFEELDVVSGGISIDGDYFTAAGAGGALGGAMATGTLAGTGLGASLGLAVGAAFAVGYGTATALGAGSIGRGIGSWVATRLK